MAQLTMREVAPGEVPPDGGTALQEDPGLDQITGWVLMALSRLAGLALLVVRARLGLGLVLTLALVVRRALVARLDVVGVGSRRGLRGRHARLRRRGVGRRSTRTQPQSEGRDDRNNRSDDDLLHADHLLSNLSSDTVGRWR